MAKSIEGASNFSLILKIMSKIALAEGQENVGACTVYCRHHGQAVIIMKNHHQTLQIKSCGENFCPSEFGRKHLMVHQNQAAAAGAHPECRRPGHLPQAPREGGARIRCQFLSKGDCFIFTWALPAELTFITRLITSRLS